jgi:acetyl esterase/lipase
MDGGYYDGIKGAGTGPLAPRSLIFWGLLTNPAAAEVRVQTYTYKQVGDLEIKADVYRENDETIRPVVVWIHGGALIVGGRSGIDGRVKKMFLDAGYALVSIDYRLAPETKLPAILEDIEDAFIRQVPFD